MNVRLLDEPRPDPVDKPVEQGLLTLVHFSAQRKRFLRDRECIQGLFRGDLRGVWGTMVC